jgi:hypothetical protein
MVKNLRQESTALGQGYVPGSKVRALENALVKIAHRGNELRKAQLLQAPPTGHAWTSYDFAGSARIAMRVQVNGSTDQVYYLLTDPLGSTAITVGTNNSKVAEIRYKPWGETRYTNGSTPTDYLFTSQREEDYIGLSYFNARCFESSSAAARQGTALPSLPRRH